MRTSDVEFAMVSLTLSVCITRVFVETDRGNRPRNPTWYIRYVLGTGEVKEV